MFCFEIVGESSQLKVLVKRAGELTSVLFVSHGPQLSSALVLIRLHLATACRCCRVLRLFFLGGLGEELILWNRHLNEVALRYRECRLLARDSISVKHLLKWHATAVEGGRLIGGLLLRVERLLHWHHIVIVGERRIADLICGGRH